MKIPKDMTDWERRPNGIWARKVWRKSKPRRYQEWQLYYEKKCEACGDPCLVLKSVSERNSGGGRFCDWRCAYRGNPAMACHKGEANGRWRGGRKIHSCDYVLIKRPKHPRADKQGYVPEHVLVAEEEFSRFLTSNEVVHHINRERKDNRPQNLAIINQSEHHKIHGQLRRGGAIMHNTREVQN